MASPLTLFGVDIVGGLHLLVDSDGVLTLLTWEFEVVPDAAASWRRMPAALAAIDDNHSRGVHCIRARITRLAHRKPLQMYNVAIIAMPSIHARTMMASSQ